MKQKTVAVKKIKKIRYGWLFGLVVPCTSMALNMIPSNSHYYYQLDGGSTLNMPPVTQQHTLRMGGDLNTDLGFTCTGFNPAVSVQNYFNNLQNSMDGLNQDILGSMTAAVGSAAMLGLEKANPELYNLLQNTMTHAEDTFRLSMKSCQTALTEIKHGKSPYQDWFSVSDSQGWLTYAKAAKADSSSVDVNQAAKEVTENNGKYGVPWVHQGKNSGGTLAAQVPIQVIGDVVIAGYNVLVDTHRALDDVSAPDEKTNPFHRYWATPNDAAAWATFILGDITLAQGTANETHAGIGLSTLLQSCPPIANNDLTCLQTLRAKFIQLIRDHPAPLTVTELQAVSTENWMVTPEVIQAIRRQSPEEQAISVNALAENIAIQQLTNEALLLRQLLLAGSQTPPVHNLQPALTAVHSAVSELDQAIKQLLFEHQMRQTLLTHTAQLILQSDAEKTGQALAAHEDIAKPLLQAGAVYKKEGASHDGE